MRLFSKRGDTIKEGVANAFRLSLSRMGDWRPNTSGLDFAPLSSLDSQATESPFSKEEVFVAMSNLEGDKAPRPCGFYIAFW